MDLPFHDSTFHFFTFSTRALSVNSDHAAQENSMHRWSRSEIKKPLPDDRPEKQVTRLARSFLVLTLMIAPAATLAAPEAAPAGDYFKKAGDSFYTRRDYETAHLHYLHLYRLKPDEDSASRLLLTSLRREDHRMLKNLLHHPLPDTGFTYTYLAVYAACRLQNYDLARPILESYESRRKSESHSQSPASTDPLQDTEDRRLQFLRGAEMLDLRRFDEALLYYDHLSRYDDVTGKRSLALANDLRHHSQIPRKSPSLAASLSAILPGAGQAYTEHYSDAAIAFFWNLATVGGSVYLYDLERSAGRPHTGSIVMGLAGLVFYVSTVAGAYSSAHRRNVFMERRFAEHLRRTYFSTDLIERESGIEFSRPLE
jgi:hypothetical protein